MVGFAWHEGEKKLPNSMREKVKKKKNSSEHWMNIVWEYPTNMFESSTGKCNEKNFYSKWMNRSDLSDGRYRFSGKIKHDSEHTLTQWIYKYRHETLPHQFRLNMLCFSRMWQYLQVAKETVFQTEEQKKFWYSERKSKRTSAWQTHTQLLI